MARTPFHITRNELAAAEERRTEWLLLRLWNFARKPRAFELHPPLNTHITLIATSFEPGFSRWITNLKTCLVDSAIRINAIS